MPQALHTGYGWLQLAMWGKIAIELMLIIVIAKILATSFSVRSGGSGGVFAPSVVIGGFLGGAFGTIVYGLIPESNLNPGIFVLIGMGAFFAAAAKVPLASIIMVAEMTGDYNLLAPAFLASIISYLVSGDDSIYDTQLEYQFRSPFHEHEVLTGLLSSLKVKNIITPDIVVAPENMNFNELEKLFKEHHRLVIPVIDSNEHFKGLISLDRILEVPIHKIINKKAKDLIKYPFIYVTPEDFLLDALYKMLEFELPEIPVFDESTMNLVGFISSKDILKYFQLRTDDFFEEIKSKNSSRFFVQRLK